MIPNDCLAVKALTSWMDYFFDDIIRGQNTGRWIFLYRLASGTALALAFPPQASTASLHFAPYPQVLLHYHRKKQPSELREKLRQNSKPAILFTLKACHIVQKREETRSGKNTLSQKSGKPSPAGFCWGTMQASETAPNPSQ